VMICLISTVLSPLIMNDTVCLIFSRMIVRDLVGIHDRFPYLLALATATDIGSALTNVGNPQNVLISVTSGLGFYQFFKFMAIPVMVSMLILITMLIYCNSKELSTKGENAQNVDCQALETTMPTKSRSIRLHKQQQDSHVQPGLHEPEPELELEPEPVNSATPEMPGAAPTTNGIRQEDKLLKDSMTTPFLKKHIDTPLLLLFSGQFIMVQGLVDTGIPTCMWDATMPPDPLQSFGTCIVFSIVIVILSNLISNVPLILMMRPMLSTLMRDDPNEAQAVWLVVAFVCASANSVHTGSLAGAVDADTWC
jgi:Na+/H+ antiporter NhaD/arsenite permease-like protein